MTQIFGQSLVPNFEHCILLFWALHNTSIWAKYGGIILALYVGICMSVIWELCTNITVLYSITMLVEQGSGHYIDGRNVDAS